MRTRELGRGVGRRSSRASARSSTLPSPSTQHASATATTCSTPASRFPVAVGARRRGARARAASAIGARVVARRRRHAAASRRPGVSRGHRPLPGSVGPRRARRLRAARVRRLARVPTHRPDSWQRPSTMPRSCSTSAPACARPVSVRTSTFRSSRSARRSARSTCARSRTSASTSCPAPTYVRGFLRSYAEALGLDGQPFVDEYNSRFTVGEDDAPLRAHRAPVQRRDRGPRESRMAAVALAGDRDRDGARHRCVEVRRAGEREGPRPRCAGTGDAGTPRAKRKPPVWSCGRARAARGWRSALTSPRREAPLQRHARAGSAEDVRRVARCSSRSRSPTTWSSA